MPLYHLINHCWQEADHIDLQSALVTQGKLTQDHSPNTKAVNERLFDVWELFINHQLNITELWNQCVEVMQEVETFRLNSGI